MFFRLMSGLQSSIMTQISLDYRFEDGRYVCHAALKTLERNSACISSGNVFAAGDAIWTSLTAQWDPTLSG